MSEKKQIEKKPKQIAVGKKVKTTGRDGRELVGKVDHYWTDARNRTRVVLLLAGGTKYTTYPSKLATA